MISVERMADPRTSLGFRAKVALRALQATNFASRRLARGTGTVIGGRVGLAVDPQLLSKLLAGRAVFLVSGTNGKTTTTAMLRAALGVPTASNLTGSNMEAGVVAALASSPSPIAVLEIDEPWLSRVLEASRHASQIVVVLLNLSRDQLDRSSEVRQLAERWRSALHDVRDVAALSVVANVNDPLVAYSVEEHARVTAVAVPLAWHADAISCPRCTRALHFESQFRCSCHDQPINAGSWSCVCGFVRPSPTVMWENGFHGESGTTPLHLAVPGRFNETNAVLAMTAALQWGVSTSEAASRICQLREVAGRFAQRRRGGRTWRLMLAKNPAGFAALFDALEKNTHDIVIEINDRVADGHDPSWLYDAPFEKLRGRRVWCSGTRALDLATRLHYGNVDFELLSDLAAPVGIEPIDVIGNYTAFAMWHKESEPC
jgi:UDP-N-acetylmuramyl tripeptide synthase